MSDILVHLKAANFQWKLACLICLSAFSVFQGTCVTWDSLPLLSLLMQKCRVTLSPDHFCMLLLCHALALSLWECSWMFWTSDIRKQDCQHAESSSRWGLLSEVEHRAWCSAGSLQKVAAAISHGSHRVHVASHSSGMAAAAAST